MQHHRTKRILGRPRRQHTALMRSLARSLVLEEKIETTLAKAKEVRPFMERLISTSREDTVSNRRRVSQELGGTSEASKKLFTDIAPRYKERDGGYTRIVRTRIRKGDAATMAQISLV